VILVDSGFPGKLVSEKGHAMALNDMGMVYDDQGKYVEAEGLFKRALAIKEKALGANHLGLRGSTNGHSQSGSKP
jgi:hypothetical protein